MPHDLTEVQRLFVGEARKQIERVLLFKQQLETFVADYDNQQAPLPTDAEVLNDATSGTTPRSDAPQITGQRIAQLRTLCNSMATQLDGPTENVLISLAVRSLETIYRNVH